MARVIYSNASLALACLIFLHTPNGQRFAVQAKSVELIKPIETRQHDHLTAHTHSLVFVGGKYHGVRETEEQVIMLRGKCSHGASP